MSHFQGAKSRPNEGMFLAPETQNSTMCPAGFLKFLDSVPFLAAWQLTARTYMCELAAMRTVHMCQLKLQPQNLKLNKLFKNYQVDYHTQHKLTQIIKCKGYPE